jgi:NAD(P)H-hydrate epimerase
MKLFTAEQIKRWDAATIDKGIRSIDLMERAAGEVAGFISDNFDKKTHIHLFAGPGNNGGDAMAVSRLLSEAGFTHLETFLVAGPSIALSSDCEANAKRLNSFVRCETEDALPDLSQLTEDVLIVDGLFGTGLSRPLEGLFKTCVIRINQSQALVISIDIPSGTYADGLLPDSSDCIHTDLVLSFQIPKRSFLFPESQRYMADFITLDIGLDDSFHQSEPCDRYFLEESMIRLPERSKFSHKGSYGHAFLVSGSRGMYGALQLCGRACLRSGAGLLTIHGPAEAMPILQAALPEAMYSMDRERDTVSELPSLDKATALACGPGLGMSQMARGLLDQLLSEVKMPLVLDADALNIIAQESWQSRIPRNTIITPHPKEFERLFGSCKTHPESVELQSKKSKELGIIIIRKGAHSTVSIPDGSVYFNSTGNPYMATGGMGDVLTGMILGLLAQGHSAEDASLAAVFYHGLTADQIYAEKGGVVLAGDVAAAAKV